MDIDLIVILVPMLSELVPFRQPAIFHGIAVFGVGVFVEDTRRIHLRSHIDAKYSHAHSSVACGIRIGLQSRLPARLTEWSFHGLLLHVDVRND